MATNDRPRRPPDVAWNRHFGGTRSVSGEPRLSCVQPQPDARHMRPSGEVTSLQSKTDSFPMPHKTVVLGEDPRYSTEASGLGENTEEQDNT